MTISRARLTLVLLLLAAALLWAAGGAAIQSLAQGGPASQPQAAMNPWLQYQGRLTYVAGGDPISGTVWMTFRLFDAPDGIAPPMWTEVKQVQVISGVFSTRLGDSVGLDPYFFNGSARWLEVAVESQNTSPRQEILPVAYALSLRPGANISGTSVEPILTLNNRGAGDALRVDGNLRVSGDLIGGTHAHAGSAINSGVVAEPRIDPAIARDAEVTAAINAALGTVPQLRYDIRAGYAASYTITIPHYQLFRLELASDWPGAGGVAVLEGFENDGRTAVTFTKYDGSTGTSGYGGAQCLCDTTNALLVFGSGGNSCGVRCAPCGGGIPYSLVITRSGGLAVNFKLIY